MVDSQSLFEGNKHHVHIVNSNTNVRQIRGDETTYGFTIIIHDEWASFEVQSVIRGGGGIHPQSWKRKLVDSQNLKDKMSAMETRRAGQKREITGV